MKRRRIVMAGSVQGVGFRPFVYNLACRYSLSGYVANTSEGILIEVQGEKDILDTFVSRLISESPSLAQCRLKTEEEIKPDSRQIGFQIKTSQNGGIRQPTITPDIATCADCLAELADPENRRYRYPFMNCTQCGPRYTIVFDIPYDRPNTTMRVFNMCPQCHREYDNPKDRRFHAQPNACPVCGPKVWLTDSTAAPLDVDDPVAMAVKKLEQGRILAIRGLGGYHLAVRADRDDSVVELRRRKYRKAKAFAVMFNDLDAARRVTQIDEMAARLLTGIEKPIVLCTKKLTSLLSEQVAPSSRFWGVMLPYTPLHALLLQGDYPALVMTSGNNTDDPIETTNQSARVRLGGIADYFLMHNRDIYTSCDDSIAKIFRDSPMIIRRARGYVPRPLRLRRLAETDILAVGAELKNTVTVLKADQAFVSQHLGDIKNACAYDHFQRTIEKLMALVGVQPRAIACDRHPAMLSTRYAWTYTGVPIIPVQHHHAHLAAVMGEHDLEGPVVGLAMDGLGYGDDGTVWGGELMVAWRDRFERHGWLEPVALPGGDAAGRQPWRMAVSYLVSAFGPAEGLRQAQELLPMITRERINTIGQIITQSINSPLTSSLGRFFDAVSAMLGVCLENTYDAQAAIELENIIDETEISAYPVNIVAVNGIRQLQTLQVIRLIVRDLRDDRSPGCIAAKFHNFLVDALAQWACDLTVEVKTDTVALAGGVFQNDTILDRLVRRLESQSRRVFFNRSLPVNDGGISFGQAVVADARLALSNEINNNDGSKMVRNHQSLNLGG